MTAFLTTLVLGVLVCVIGIINMTGNISSLHSYHRHRVKEEDIKPFGRLVGTGTLIIGVSLIFYGALFLAFDITKLGFLVQIGAFCLGVGVVLGLIITIYAMMKYNKGIF